VTQAGYATAEALKGERTLASVDPRPAIEQWVRQLRSLPDRLLHSRRRARALTRLAKARAGSVLFVCQGNICRSPFAAAAFAANFSRRLQRPTITSAGFIGPARPPPPKAVDAARRFGVDISGHRSQLITSELLQAAELIVVMTPDQARGIRSRVKSRPTEVIVLGDLDPLKSDRRGILDPWGGSDADFDSSYARVSRCIGVLAHCLIGKLEAVADRDITPPEVQ